MAEKRYNFNLFTRISRGLLGACTSLIAWGFLIFGFFFSDPTVDGILILIGLGCMIFYFLFGFLSGTSIIINDSEVKVKDKQNGWTSYPYHQYQIKLEESKRSLNFFTIYTTRKMYIYRLSDHQLVRTTSVFNIGSKELKKIEWIIRDYRSSLVS